MSTMKVRLVYQFQHSPLLKGGNFTHPTGNNVYKITSS